MPTVRGRSAVAAFFTAIPAEIETKLLRGAARAGANVIAEEAGDRANSAEVKAGLKVKLRTGADHVAGVVSVEGAWARSLGIWAEYGTDPHYISVDDAQRAGRSVGRINRQGGFTTLVINGQPVGKSVFHPGARPHPFMRVALDLKQADAVAAAQRYINARVTPGGIVGTAEPEDEPE